MVKRKKNIVIVASYLYLTEPIFLALKEILSDKNVFLYFPKDRDGREPNQKFIESYTGKDIVESSFEYYRSVKHRFLSLFFDLIRFRLYKRTIIADIASIRPDTIIYLTDMNQSSRILMSHYASIQQFIIQPSFLGFNVKRKKDRFRFFKKFLGSFFAGFFTTQPVYGLEKINVPLLVWGNTSNDYYKSKRTTIATRNWMYETMLNRRSELIQIYNCPTPFNVLVFASDLNIFYDSAFSEKINYFLEVMSRKLSKDINIVIKIHPNDDVSKWMSDTLNDDLRIKFDTSSAAPNLIEQSHLIIATDSYASLEAVYRYRIVVNYFPSDYLSVRNLKLDLVDEAYSLNATEPLEVCDFVNKIYQKTLDGDDVLEFIAPFEKTLIDGARSISDILDSVHISELNQS